MKMVTPEKILQIMNSWQSGEVIAVRRKKCSGASSRPNIHNIHYTYWSSGINSLHLEYLSKMKRRRTVWVMFITEQTMNGYVIAQSSGAGNILFSWSHQLLSHITVTIREISVCTLQLPSLLLQTQYLMKNSPCWQNTGCLYKLSQINLIWWP